MIESLINSLTDMHGPLKVTPSVAIYVKVHKKFKKKKKTFQICGIKQIIKICVSLRIKKN